MQYGQDASMIHFGGKDWYYLKDLEAKDFGHKSNGEEDFDTTLNGNIYCATAPEHVIGECLTP